MRFKLGISPCPNDTFMFHAILERKIDMKGFVFDVELLDVQELNAALSQRRFGFSKASTVAAFVESDAYSLIHAGAAVGFGVGPLLVARRGAPSLDTKHARILLPGRLTTAAMLFKRFFPASGEPTYTVFSDIMPAVHEGRADYGVVIHEGRFAYKNYGLDLVADLGELWEREYKAPLPLGCLVAERGIAVEHQANFTELVRDSIRYAYEHRDEVLLTMRRYANELSDPVLWAHVDLYVNEWSLDLGPAGVEAMRSFRQVVEHYSDVVISDVSSV